MFYWWHIWIEIISCRKCMFKLYVYKNQDSKLESCCWCSSLSLSCVSMYVYIIKVLPPKCVCVFSDWKNKQYPFALQTHLNRFVPINLEFNVVNATQLDFFFFASGFGMWIWVVEIIIKDTSSLLQFQKRGRGGGGNYTVDVIYFWPHVDFILFHLFRDGECVVA